MRELFCKHKTRDQLGRFVIGLPFRENKENLGDSREMAIKLTIKLFRAQIPE